MIMLNAVAQRKSHTLLAVMALGWYCLLAYKVHVYVSIYLGQNLFEVMTYKKSLKIGVDTKDDFKGWK